MASSQPLWTWKAVAQDELFACAYHTCTVIRDKMYIFGGVKTDNPKDSPLGHLVTFDPKHKVVWSSSHQDVFKRSHHDALELGDRWLCVVGGWDGSRRVSSVFTYDTEKEEWALWEEGPTNNPPVGLSSHTCTKISDYEVRVIGREGGLRMQRRYASVYTLRVNASTRKYCYKEEESRTASRSGHAAVLLTSNSTSPKKNDYSLYVFGGRESSSFDVAGHWSKDKIQVKAGTCPKLTEQLARLVNTAGISHAAPKSLKHHSNSIVGPFVVVFGGEILSKSRDAVSNDLYIFDTRCSPPSWSHFPSSHNRLKRVGHRTCLINDQLYLVGGFGADGKTPCSEICVLDFSS
uniref:Kelch domain containing 9 n=1 Tax=Leptobrachium leishanense TaxID=445787 RepID=A0A8C5W8N5_9ANUR